MKKFLFSALAFAMAVTTLSAQEAVKVGAYEFTKVVENQATSVKNQASSGTCWAYSGIATIESDIIKEKGQQFKDLDLSEIYVARHAYSDKFVKYVRMHGDLNFAEGGSFEDVVEMINKYGIVPQEVYEGLEYGYDKNVFGEIWEVFKGYADGIIANKNKKLTTKWREGFEALLDTYFGAVPETFMYEGVEYTPKSFAQYLGFKRDNYISFCSFTHVPYGEMHIIEVPDNWIYGQSLNVTLDDFVAIHDEVLMNGYTSAWGSDVSEKGFAHGAGLCTLPANSIDEIPGDERAKWEAVHADGKKATGGVAIEKEVTVENRQAWYDNYETTDDHGMQIVGIYKDQDGKIFYKVKNSWAESSNKFGGYFYVSQTFFKAKTLNFLVHKNSLSKKTKKKFNIE